MTVLDFLTIAFGIWLGFNLAAPYAVVAEGERISPGRLPYELFTGRGAKDVRFYLLDLKAGYGYSLWAPPLNVVVFDRAFFAHASPVLLRFVVAHELSHFTFGHHRKRWLLVVFGLGLLPWTRRLFARFEDQADKEAERLTGVTRKVLSPYR